MAVQQKKVGVFPTNYVNKTFTLLSNRDTFLKSNQLPEYQYLKSLISLGKSIFHLPDDKVTLEFVKDERIYRINMLTPDVKKVKFASFILIPLEKRLDIWDSKTLLVQSKDRRVKYKGYSVFLDRIKPFNDIIEKIVSSIF